MGLFSVTRGVCGSAKKGFASMLRSLIVTAMVAVFALSVSACNKSEQPKEAEEAAPAAETAPDAPAPAPDKPET